MTAPPAAAPLRVAVVGAGAFGRNHLRVYRELQQAGVPVEIAAVVDSNPDTLAAASAQYSVPGFATIEASLAHFDQPALTQPGTRGLHAASVCVPTVAHAECAATLLAAGIDLLIEKPLAATLAEADAIIHQARAHNLIVQVGHLERFNPAVRAARDLLNCPMFFEVHRLSVFTPRSLDVDVVLDLMIHDLDIVMNLVASPVREVRAVGLPVLSRKVDIANVRLEFENGCVANFTASRVSTEQVRKMRFFQPRQYLSLDFARQDLLLIDVPELSAANAKDPTQQPTAEAAAHPSAGLTLRKAPIEPGEPLRLELAAFLEAVRTRTQPVVTVEDGRAALALALEINAAIASHAQRTGL
ncbi:MAG: Gfo/Idh/MocA family oxidoreductase [Candidatus Cybelea sp.]